MEHPEFVDKYENSYSKIDFPNFVEEVVLKDKFPRTESELDDLNGSGVWVKLHWAPYWFTCGLCSVPFDVILHTDTLHQDIHHVLKDLKIPDKDDFPKVRVTGDGDHAEERYLESDLLAEKYFIQLTKQQVLRLYEMYKIDHYLFGYHPQIYMDMAV